MARTSTPGLRLSVFEPLAQEDGLNHLDSDVIPCQIPNYDMQYGGSRKTGLLVGGFYWNPPDDCIGKIHTYGGERWVDVNICNPCSQRRSCEAQYVDRNVKQRAQMDIPENRPRGRRRS